MNRPTRLLNRKGNGLVEAAMVMPFFFLAVLMLLSPIPAASSWENVIFSMCDELRYESAKAAFMEQPSVMKIRMKNRITEENPRVDGFKTENCRYLYRQGKIADLITVGYEYDYAGFDFSDAFRSASFEMQITGRAFTGKLHKRPPAGAAATAAEDDTEVYIFPEWGMRYHKKTCTYVKSSCEMVYLTAVIKRRYDPCSLCQAKSAQIGSPVFCFTKYGKVYHLDHCGTIERYYVTMEKTKAVHEGYTPCLKCGG